MFAPFLNGALRQVLHLDGASQLPYEKPFIALHHHHARPRLALDGAQEKVRL
jgi:hypothetical protein